MGYKKVEISNCDFIKVLDPLCCAAAVWLKDSPGQQARAMASRAAQPQRICGHKTCFAKREIFFSWTFSAYSVKVLLLSNFCKLVTL